LSVSSGDFPGGYTVSGNDAGTQAPGITNYDQLQEMIEVNPVDMTQTEDLLAGINDRLTVVVLFCVALFVYAICRAVYRFLNGLFG